MTHILTNFLVVFNSGGGEYLYHESFINFGSLLFLRKERELEVVCVLLDFKQYFRSCMTAYVIFPSVIWIVLPAILKLNDNCVKAYAFIRSSTPLLHSWHVVITFEVSKL